MTPSVRESAAADRDGIRAVHRAAFAREAEVALVDGLIDSGEAILSLVAVENGIPIGHILFSRLAAADDRGIPLAAAALAPLAVLPARQRRGVGSTLVRQGLRRIAQRGVAVAIVLGDPAYYGRFGFSPDLTRSLRGPFRGPAWMAIELAPKALAGFSGTVRYSDAFEIVAG